MSDDLIKRLQGVVWCTFDTLEADHTLAVEAAAALAEAQATIARLEALLMEASPWLDDGDPKSELRLRIDAALSPREGES